MTVSVANAHAHVQRLVSVVKMATVLEGMLPKSSAVFCVFWWAKGLNAKDIHKEMFPVYGRKCLSRKTVHKWIENFAQGRSIVAADDARPCRLVEIAIEAAVQQVEELIRADRLAIDSVASALGCSHGLAYSIMHDHLKFRNLCSRRLPRELKDREKITRTGLSL
jgi:hypothetical protein